MQSRGWGLSLIWIAPAIAGVKKMASDKARHNVLLVFMVIGFIDQVVFESQRRRS